MRLKLRNYGIVLIGPPRAGQQLCQAAAAGARAALQIEQTMLKGRKQELLALKCVQKRHLVIVHGEVHDTTSELEELLARVAVAAPVLLDGILDGL